MAFVWFAVFAAAGLCVLVLDAARKIDLMLFLPRTLAAVVLCNAVLLFYGLNRALSARVSGAGRWAALALAGLFVLYLFLRLAIFNRRDRSRATPRLKVMMGGRRLVGTGLWMMPLEALLLALGWGPLLAAGCPAGVLTANAVAAALLLLFFVGLGALRLFFTSRRLSLVWRLALLFTWWVPLLNLFVLWRYCALARDEYDFALYKQDLHLTRAESDLCRTRYPIILVHGVLFRDLRYFNYWGRIPRELLRCGAALYYGNQEAVGTAAYNANDLCRRIEEVCRETGCEKVNIIAHSKGGLDARYAVTVLGAAERVASLTTMSSPHWGCRFVDYACKLPEGVFRAVAKVFDNTFRRMGDANPDFYTAIHEFSTASSAAFNERVHDMPEVYCQSFTTKLRGALSDSLLGLPYLMIKPLEGENDGLVSTRSAMWGNFRGVLTARGRRGVSHGDIIDLKREDYKGFDVLETYVSIVSELKNMGF